MAKIRYGPTIADVRGSVGPFTYTRNTAGHYIAQRSTKVSGLTARAVAARATLAAAAQAWRALTAVERIAWGTLAAVPPEIDYDPWAVQKFLSGFGWFVRIYTRQVSTSETLPTIPPTDAQPTPPTITAATIAAYGSPNGSSYVTFTSPQPNLIPNGGWEPPYTNGLAASWWRAVDADFVTTEENVDVAEGLAAQRVACTASATIKRIYGAAFTVTVHPGYWFSCATKFISGQLGRLDLVTADGFEEGLFVGITNPGWLYRSVLWTPHWAGAAYIRTTTFGDETNEYLLDGFKFTAPEYFILSAAVAPSPGRQTPDQSYRLLHAGYSTTPTIISIGDALAALLGAYPAGWTVFLKLARQTISGLRSAPVLFTTTTG